MKNERVRCHYIFPTNCKNRNDASRQYKLGTIEHTAKAKNYSTALGNIDLVNGSQPKHETSTHFIPDRQVQNRSMYVAQDIKLKKQGVQSMVVVLRMTIDIPLTLRVRGYERKNLSHLGQSNLRNTISTQSARWKRHKYYNNSAVW